MKIILNASERQGMQKMGRQIFDELPKAITALKIAEVLGAGEDEAVAGLFVAEDRLLASSDTSIPARVAKDMIRLRRLAIAAAEEDDIREFEVIRDDLCHIVTGAQKLAAASVMLLGLAVRHREVLLASGRFGGVSRTSGVDGSEDAGWIMTIMTYALEAIAAAAGAAPADPQH